MKFTSLAWGILLAIVMPQFAAAQQNYLSKVKIYAPKDRQVRSEILGHLQIDHFMPTKDGAILAELGQEDMAKLRASSYKYEVLIPNLSTWLDSVNRIYYASLNNPSTSERVAFEQPGGTIASMMPKPAAFEVKATFGGYYNYTEIVAAIDALVAAYPAIASKTNIGTTAEGRTIWMVKIPDNVATDEPNEPEALFMGLQHAREAITGSATIFTMQFLCDQYSKDARIKSLVDNREVYIIPCFNPDGWEYNRTSMSGNAGGSWRKNRRPNAGGTFGVDLNRNWGVDWANCSAPIQGSTTSCGSGTSSGDTYWGTAAFSEAETQAVRNFTKSKHIVVGFDQHAYGPYYSLPFGRQTLHTMSEKGTMFYNTIPALMGKYNGMRAADSYDALGYEVAGGFKDWMLMGENGTSISGGLKDSVWAMTGEGGAGDGTAAYGSMASFWAPAGEILNLSKGMCYQNLQLLYAAGTYVDVQDEGGLALSSLSGTLNYRIKRLGLGNDPVTVQLVPIENMRDAGGGQVIPNMNFYYGEATGSIAYNLFSNTVAGQRIKYAWKVTAGGITYSDTIIKYYNPTVVYSDNFEGTFATNWTNTAAAGASGFGYNYTAGSWVFTASGGYNSTKALSESAAGTSYTTSSIRTAQLTPVLNLLGATSARMSFMVKHYTENFRDKLQVQVSTNGTTWVAIPGSTTVQEPGTVDDATINGQPAMTGIQDYWIPVYYNLDNYVGNAALRLRFVFTSDNDLSTFTKDVDDGFYIDNLSIVKSTSAMNILPVQFLSFTAALQPNRTVDLAWEAAIDNEHAYFTVERSEDGSAFHSIGSPDPLTPFKYTDLKPATGTNYYRIRQVDVSGKVSYSVVRTVNVIDVRGIYVYPNPAKDVVNVKVSGAEREKLRFDLTDIQGRVVSSTIREVDAVSSLVTLNLSTLKPQVYILKVVDVQGKVVATERVTKL